MTVFYLGTHRRTWLERLDVRLCVSRHHFLTGRGVVSDRLPSARAPWFLDSSSFSEVGKKPYGWHLPAETFVAQVREIVEGVGSVAHVGPQDWMCEPEMVALTGLSVREHQERTVDNYVQLRDLAPDLPWVPVLQGWEAADYGHCIDLYEQRGVDLGARPLVGLGTVCRRQATREIGEVVSSLAHHRLKLHGFGVKLTGLRMYGHCLASADSLAWSINGRWTGNRCGSDEHKACNNCIDFALWWREHKALPALGLWAA